MKIPTTKKKERRKESTTIWKKFMPLITDIMNTHYVLCWLYQRLNLQTRMRMRFRFRFKRILAKYIIGELTWTK